MIDIDNLGKTERWVGVESIEVGIRENGGYENRLGLAIIYDNTTKKGNEFHSFRNLEELKEFMKVYMRRGIKLKNPHPLSSMRALDKTEFKKLEKILENGNNSV